METKLLTEAEARRLAYSPHPESTLTELRERGLIAPEPVDLLLIEAREIAAAHIGSEAGAASFRAGNGDNDRSVLAILAALKRGMEMRAPLTREMVRDALLIGVWNKATTDSDVTRVFGALHAALTKEQS